VRPAGYDEKVFRACIVTTVDAVYTDVITGRGLENYIAMGFGDRRLSTKMRQSASEISEQLS